MPRDGWNRHYLYCQFQQSAFHDDLAQGASGTSNSHQRIRPGDLMAKSIVSPSEAMRQSFAALADSLFEAIASMHEESRKLAEMRDYLLPKLISGELRTSCSGAFAQEMTL